MHATLGEDSVVAGLEITAYPFDPQQILDSLAALATESPPTFPDLEREMATYRPPDDARFEEAGRPWRALRDTVAAVSDSMLRMDRRSPTYAAAYERFRALYTRLARRAAERDAALRALNGPQLDLARRVQAAAEALRAWEYDAYAEYADVAARHLQETGRQIHTVTTDPAGVARLALEPGSWWLVARLPDAENPFLERYWHVPIGVSRLVPLRVPMGERAAETRWRR
jgi:hypothetical protein